MKILDIGRISKGRMFWGAELLEIENQNSLCFRTRKISYKNQSFRCIFGTRKMMANKTKLPSLFRTTKVLNKF